MEYKAHVAGVLSALLLTGTSVLQAQEPVVSISVVCPATGPGIGVCAGIGILLHEVVQKANGKDAFGNNGEIMKILRAPLVIADANARGAQRESGDIDKAIRLTTGVSLKDIKEKGLLGGDNSEARKLCNAIAAIGGGKC